MRGQKIILDLGGKNFWLVRALEGFWLRIMFSGRNFMIRIIMIIRK